MTIRSIIELCAVAVMAFVLSYIGLASLDAVRAEARADYFHSQWLDAKEKREERQKEEQLERCALVMARFGQMADSKTFTEPLAIRVWEFCLQNPGVTRQEP